jgi:hypothetical protein
MYHSIRLCVGSSVLLFRHVSTHLRVILEGDFLERAARPGASREEARGVGQCCAAAGSGGLAVTCLYLYRRPW